MRHKPLFTLGYALLILLLAAVVGFLFFLSPPLTAAGVILLVLFALRRQRQRWLHSAPPPQKQAGVRLLRKRSWVDEHDRLRHQMEFTHPEWGEQTLTYEVPEAVYNAHQEGEVGTLTIQAQSWAQPT